MVDRATPRAPDGGLFGTRGLIATSWIGTVVLVASALAAVAVGDRTFDVVVVIPALVLFALGCITFLWAFGVAVGRSRFEEIGIGGLFFASGSSPVLVRNQLMASLAIEVLVALGTAAARPFTAQAFAVLAPMFGLGVAGLRGALHGTFGERVGGGASGAPSDEGG